MNLKTYIIQDFPEIDNQNSVMIFFESTYYDFAEQSFGKSLIYIREGRIGKNSIMRLGEYEYRIDGQKSATRLYWGCNYKEKYNCKSRLITFGNHLMIRKIDHNHDPYYKTNCVWKPKKVIIFIPPHINVGCKGQDTGYVSPTILQDQLSSTPCPGTPDSLGLMDFRGVIYFRKGQKRPIMVLGQYEYKVERQTTPTNMCWCCTNKEKLKCKARVITFGNHVVVKRMDHNHEPTFKGDRAMERKQVIISYGGSNRHEGKPKKNKKGQNRGVTNNDNSD
ncbi:hypothetical protein ABEB36_014885 [Hypothenemus hampei]|uniref:FLYWCH-type domain-containing protein n=1 Tax=Hypothenemus hampei TaxID=57062 RepID=A0ABD1E5S4_HYPHA